MNLEKFEQVEVRFHELEGLLADPKIISNQSQYQKLAKEYSNITPIVTTLRKYKDSVKQAQELTKFLQEKHDKEFEHLAHMELQDLDKAQKDLINALNDLINPKKQEKDRDLIIEIRAGTGGEEASLFAADLYRMYTKFADKKGWKVELMSLSESDTKGIKEVVFSVSGPGAEKHLKWESGAHRVQRVPTTEASGRIHTSAATVAVLFEPEEIDLKIEPKD